MAYASRGVQDGTGPYGGGTGRGQGICGFKRHPIAPNTLSGTPGVTSVAWTLFKAAITYGVIHFLWLRK